MNDGGGDRPSVAIDSVEDLVTDTANAENPFGSAQNQEEDADANNRTSQKSNRVGLLREWVSPPNVDVDAPVNPGVEYAYADETPYEHNFEPGDHIIRWDVLPILWPIQIHGIVLEVSEDKSEVTICDFGVTSVENDAEGKRLDESRVERTEKIVEEENTKFNEAIQDEVNPSGSGATDESSTKHDPNKIKRQRLNVVKLTKWSDLRKWHKVDYEGGFLNAGSGVGKGLKTLGEKTEKLWTSVTNSFVKNDKPRDKKVRQTVRFDVDDKGYCVHHPEIQLKRMKDDGDLVTVRKKCPKCILLDCPAMMGKESPKSEASSLGSVQSMSITETDHPGSQSKGITNKPDQSQDKCARTDIMLGDITNYDENLGGVQEEPKTIAQMVAEANEVERRSRKANFKAASTERRIGQNKKSWNGSFVKSLSSVFQKNETGASTTESASLKEQSRGNGRELKKLMKTSNSQSDLPRSDPPALVLARTRFILEHGENILPPYHIINSNSECIAVWCKTGRWSTLQASVFLHSTAIGHAKSATALTIGVAATQPWLIPAMATVGLAAVGTPWLFLKVANDKWNEATLSLTQKFWSEAEPAVFVECIEKWSGISKPGH
ncbi:hypothetical protein ACHAWF_002545 [Thalassiosira exigua]